MRKIPAFVAVLLLALNGVGTWWAWTLWRTANISPLVRASVPVIPVLDNFSRLFVDRINLATTVARRTYSLGAMKELALLYHANGLRREAEQVERGLRVLEPREPRWTYYLADLRLAEGDTREAEALLRETLRLAPGAAPVELKLADLLFRQGRGEEAAAHYERRLKLMPGDPYSQLGLARISVQTRDFPKAARQLEALLEASPKFPTAHNLLVELYLQLDEAKNAETQRRLAAGAGRFRAADDPWLDQVQDWCYDSYHLEVLGGTDRQTGQLTQSLPFYERAVRVAGGDGAAYNALGDVYKLLNRLDDAEAILNEGLKRAPQTESLFGTLSGVLLKKRKTAEAIALVRRGVARFPESAEMRNELAIALEGADQGEEAVRAYREAVRLNPYYADAYYNLGLRLHALGRLDEARASFQHTLEVRPSDSKTLLVLAQDEIKIGRLDAALNRLQVLSTFHSDLPEVQQLWGTWHLQKGLMAAVAHRFVEAQTEFLAGLEINPNTPGLHANLGAVLAQQGNYAEALVHFERFLALAPQELSAYLYLSQTLLALHRPGDAREILERGSSIARQAEQNPLNATTITRLGEVWEQVNAALKGEVTPPSKP